EAEPVHRGRAARTDYRGVPRRDVADVPREAVCGIESVEAAHQTITRHLGDDRRGSDRPALLVAVHDGRVAGGGPARQETVAAAGLGRRGKGRENRSEAGEVRAVEAVAVDFARGNHAHGEAFREADDGAEEILAPFRRALLRVVEEAERPDAVVAQRAVVE